MKFPVYLFEVNSLDASNNPVTHYWATRGYTTAPTDSPANRHYLEVVADPGTFSQSLYAEGATRGDSQISNGGIKLSNANGELDHLVSHSFDGRTFTIKRLPEEDAPYYQAVTILNGILEGLDSSQAWLYLTLRIYDYRRKLDKPVQANRYAGTTITSNGTIEGTEDQKGDIKPLAYGRVRGIEPVVVNPFQWLYQLSDNVISSAVCYDGGSARTPRGDHATVSAALSASILAGQFNTCYDKGIVRFGGISPRYVLTCDMTEGSGTANRYAGAIAVRILNRMGFTSGDYVQNSFNTLDAAVPYEMGLYIDSEETGISALGRLLSSIGAYIIPNESGQFTAGRISFGTPVGTITVDDAHADRGGVGLFQNPDTEANVPCWRVVLRYQKLHRTLDNGSMAGCAAMNEPWKSYLMTEWREVTAENATVKTNHPLAQEFIVETCIDSQANAQAEANRLLSMYSVRRDVMTFDMIMTESYKLGDTVNVLLPRFGYDSGRQMIVIGRVMDFRRDMCTLTLWG